MSTETEPRRGPGRPPMRAETREQPRLQRKHKSNQDKFHIPDGLKKDGYDYNWKAVEVYGKPVEAGQIMEFHENHWEPVQADEIRGIMPPDYNGSIQKGGLMLMKRPSYLSDEARSEELDAARRQSGAKRESIRQGGDNGVMPVREALIRSDIGGQQIPD